MRRTVKEKKAVKIPVYCSNEDGFGLATLNGCNPTRAMKCGRIEIQYFESIEGPVFYRPYYDVLFNGKHALYIETDEEESLLSDLIDSKMIILSTGKKTQYLQSLGVLSARLLMNTINTACEIKRSGDLDTVTLDINYLQLCSDPYTVFRLLIELVQKEKLLISLVATKDADVFSFLGGL